jgi:hypothetical protein
MKIVFIIIIIILLLMMLKDNGIVFNGSNFIRFPNKLLKKNTMNEFSFELKFPNKIEDGIIFYARNEDNFFQIVYIKDNVLIININNNSDEIVTLNPNLEPYKNGKLLRFSFFVDNNLNNANMYIGGIPDTEISNVQDFTSKGLVATARYIYLNEMYLNNILHQ